MDVVSIEVQKNCRILVKDDNDEIKSEFLQFPFTTTILNKKKQNCYRYYKLLENNYNDATLVSLLLKNN